LSCSLYRGELPLHGDVSDWLDAGHGHEELSALVEAAGAAESPDADPEASLAFLMPADLARLTEDVMGIVRRYVALTDHQAIATALWVAHTYTLSAFECTPYLQVTSATKRSGKTRLLEVLEQLVARPWFTGRTSAAALTRKIDAESPTLLLDESDAAFSGPAEYTEALRGVLNSGYRKSGKVTLCAPQGKGFATKDFNTYGAKAIAGIGKLPDTVNDRSIPIGLRRRTREETISRWRERDGRREAKPIREALAAWSTGAIAPLRDARPDVPLALNDRAADVWEPLLAIADMAGGDWPRKAREAALALTGQEPDDDTIGIQLLADLRDAFDDAEVLSSHELIQQLVSRDDRPWATWSKGKQITGHALTRLLRPFGVVPGGTMRVEGKPARAYRRAAFEDAWLRYLPAPERPEEIPAPVPPVPPAETDGGSGEDEWLVP
jgi:uncharacterized protein DUF3631